MRRWARFRLPALSGALAALSFPPFDLGPLIFVAPVPLLVAWTRARRARQAALDGFVAGMVFFGAVVVWAWYFGAVAYLPFVAALSLYWAGAGALTASLAGRDGAAGPWTASAVWVLFEALRGRWPFGGFSWAEFGYALHDVPWLRTGAAWGGVLLLSFGIMLVAAHLVVAGTSWRAGERHRAARALAVAAAVPVVLTVSHAVLPDTEAGERLRIAVVQGNDLNRDLTGAEIRGRYLARSHFRLAENLDGPVDLVVLPESSLDEDPRLDPFLADSLGAIARRLDAHVVANAAVEIDDGRRLENTNFLYDPVGRLTDTYVKQHLVPYGEWVPGRAVLEDVISELDQIPRDYAPGPRRRTFDVGGVPVANLICFESAFTEIARSYADDGVQVLLVSTNNRSFRRSANTLQHLAIGQLRAIETGRPLVQAAISGRSAFIDRHGDVVTSTSLFERTTLTRTVTGRTGSTPYVVVGDWVIALAGSIALAAAWRARGRGRFAPSAGGS